MILSALVRKQRLILLVSLGLIVLTAIASMAWGYSSLSFDRLIPVLFGTKAPSKKSLFCFPSDCHGFLLHCYRAWRLRCQAPFCKVSPATTW